MRRHLIAVVAAGLFACLGGSLACQEKPREGVDPARLKEWQEVRRKMYQIEKKVAAEDAELKQIAEQMQALMKKRQERMETLLKNNTEYQQLKKREAELNPSPEGPAAGGPKPEVR